MVFQDLTSGPSSGCASGQSFHEVYACGLNWGLLRARRVWYIPLVNSRLDL